MKIHVFASSDEAYDASQCRDDILDGDILIVPNEGVAGWLSQAWPIAATRNTGAFHRLNEAAAINAQAFGPDTGQHIEQKINAAIAALHSHGRTIIAVEQTAHEAALEDEAHSTNADYDAEHDAHEAALEDDAHAMNADYDAEAATA
ncbi:hypothetical protein IU433_14190 [Nocardia puris]|uniref:hypothetical protein n=1 Tax=Nocardia puris TaxID=208602 RepID=UPI0018931641|nr:hypothetical protein [Nocardia puris]MBF6460187.1 hypothetical protein [Nocardia puris]